MIKHHSSWTAIILSPISSTVWCVSPICSTLWCLSQADFNYCGNKVKISENDVFILTSKNSICYRSLSLMFGREELSFSDYLLLYPALLTHTTTHKHSHFFKFHLIVPNGPVTFFHIKRRCFDVSMLKRRHMSAGWFVIINFRLKQVFCI